MRETLVVANHVFVKSHGTLQHKDSSFLLPPLSSYMSPNIPMSVTQFPSPHSYHSSPLNSTGTRTWILRSLFHFWFLSVLLSSPTISPQGPSPPAHEPASLRVYLIYIKRRTKQKIRYAMHGLGNHHGFGFYFGLVFFFT